jgi:hypothetical protein
MLMRGIVKRNESDDIAPSRKLLCEGSHCKKEGDYLLNVVANVGRLLTNLHEHILGYGRVFREPGVVDIKLVSQNEAQDRLLHDISLPFR